MQWIGYTGNAKSECPNEAYWGHPEVSPAGSHWPLKQLWQREEVVSQVGFSRSTLLSIVRGARCLLGVNPWEGKGEAEWQRKKLHCVADRRTFQPSLEKEDLEDETPRGERNMWESSEAPSLDGEAILTLQPSPAECGHMSKPDDSMRNRDKLALPEVLTQRIMSFCFKPQSFGMVCYAARDNWYILSSQGHSPPPPRKILKFIFIITLLL